MKKNIIAVICLFFTMVTFVSAQTDSELLQQKLAKFNALDADFSQQVISPEGNLIQESLGKLVISRPGNFYWEVTSPEQELIVSNGIDVWLYSPFIEQVTIMNFADAIAGTPFALLSGADAADWANFTVKKTGEEFVISSNDSNSRNKFVFRFDKDDKIAGFSVIEELGQKSVFTLTNNINAKPLNDDFYNFKIPSGVEIDDQR
ncbi:outer membrane lipoprotein chaperone LolA [Psychromonas aquatilis]|uniref:Outer-membrane lipoprotein carrier protein n=1 Tax=Psychromonas aquatilis TaxID=2005072 RepID=A0ABU9GQK0_9GAMM